MAFTHSYLLEKLEQSRAPSLPQVVLSCVHWYYVPLGLPSCRWLTSHLWLIEHLVTKKKTFRTGEGLPSSLHPLSYHADPSTPEDSSLSLQDLNSFHGLRLYALDSASSLSSCEAFLTTRQDSLHVTAWHVARLVSDRAFVDTLLRTAFAIRKYPSYAGTWLLPRPDFHRLEDACLWARRK